MRDIYIACLETLYDFPEDLGSVDPLAPIAASIVIAYFDARLSQPNCSDLETFKITFEGAREMALNGIFKDFSPDLMEKITEIINSGTTWLEFYQILAANVLRPLRDYEAARASLLYFIVRFRLDPESLCHTEKEFITLCERLNGSLPYPQPKEET